MSPLLRSKQTDTSYTNLVRPIIVDEIHLLHDERGPVIEALIARTIRRMEQTLEFVRLVALSATSQLSSVSTRIKPWYSYIRERRLRGRPSFYGCGGREDNYTVRKTRRGHEIFTEGAVNVKDSNLRDLLPFGFAIHRAGMSREDRGLVEELFADGSIHPGLGSQLTGTHRYYQRHTNLQSGKRSLS